MECAFFPVLFPACIILLNVCGCILTMWRMDDVKSTLPCVFYVAVLGLYREIALLPGLQAELRREE